MPQLRLWRKPANSKMHQSLEDQVASHSTRMDVELFLGGSQKSEHSLGGRGCKYGLPGRDNTGISLRKTPVCLLVQWESFYLEDQGDLVRRLVMKVFGALYAL